MVAVVLRDEDINFTLNPNHDREAENEIKTEQKRPEGGEREVEKKNKEI